MHPENAKGWVGILATATLCAIILGVSFGFATAPDRLLFILLTIIGGAVSIETLSHYTRRGRSFIISIAEWIVTTQTERAERRIERERQRQTETQTPQSQSHPDHEEGSITDDEQDRC